MHRLLRIVFLWLLAFAVPAQGFAAASMRWCETGAHHHSEPVSAMTATMVGEVGGDGHHAHAHAHAHAHDHAHAADASAQHGAGSVHDVAGKCGTCAACCTAAMAAPVAIIAFKPVQVDDALVAIEPQADVAFLTDGPERPPRTLLA